MAKRGTLDHPKTLALARRLKVEPWAALGLLEAFWHWVGRYAPTGDITDVSVEDIGDGVRARRDPQKLLDAMLAERWLDRHNGRLYVHDWPDHADDAAKKHLSRTRREFAEYYKTESRQGRDLGEGQGRDKVGTESRLSSPEPIASPEPSPAPAPAVATGSRRDPDTHAPEADIRELEKTADDQQRLSAQHRSAVRLVDELMPRHPKPGQRASAIRAVEAEIANTVDPIRFSEQARTNHSAYVEYWAHEKTANPRLFIPSLAAWFSEGDYLHPPARLPAAHVKSAKEQQMERIK